VKIGVDIYCQLMGGGLVGNAERLKGLTNVPVLKWGVIEILPGGRPGKAG